MAMAAGSPLWNTSTSTDVPDGVTDLQNTTADTDDQDNINLNAALHMQVIYGLIGLMGISGNALVAAVLLHFKATRKSLTNIFIINQSLIDATSSLFIVLSTFIRDVSVISSPLGQELFCRLWLTNLPIWGLFVSSTYNMVAVTFERYYAVVHPLRHHMYFTHKKALMCIVVVWIVGPAFNAAYMIPTAGMVHGECTVYSIYPSEQWHTAVGIITVLLQYFIPLGFVIYAYVRIAIVLTKAVASSKDVGASRKTHRDVRIARARQNVIKTLALVCACFCLCWSCNQIYYTMYNIGYDANFNGTFYHFTVILVFCNCCINPLAYAVKYEQFKRGFRKIFCKEQDNAQDFSTNTMNSNTADDPDQFSRIQSTQSRDLENISKNQQTPDSSKDQDSPRSHDTDISGVQLSASSHVPESCSRIQQTKGKSSDPTTRSEVRPEPSPISENLTISTRL